MWKLPNWIKKLWSGSSKSEGTFPPPPPTPSVKPSEIENEIDRIVSSYLPRMGNLINYNSTTKHWQAVFKALAYAESGFKLNCRYVEPPSLGKDAVTGIQNTSEGLLQLSYQDAKYHSCEFDWSIDKKLHKDSMLKTIFNLEKNIKCGMQIMNKLIGKKNHYIFNDGNYWAVLKPNNKRHKVFLSKYNQYTRMM